MKAVLIFIIIVMMVNTYWGFGGWSFKADGEAWFFRISCLSMFILLIIGIALTP